jgi:hypothetical protein
MSLPSLPKIPISPHARNQPQSPATRWAKRDCEICAKKGPTSPVKQPWFVVAALPGPPIWLFGRTLVTDEMFV